MLRTEGVESWRVHSGHTGSEVVVGLWGAGLVTEMWTRGRDEDTAGSYLHMRHGRKGEGVKRKERRAEGGLGRTHVEKASGEGGAHTTDHSSTSGGCPKTAHGRAGAAREGLQSATWL